MTASTFAGGRFDGAEFGVINLASARQISAGSY